MTPGNRNLQSKWQKPVYLPLSVSPNSQDERRSQLNVVPPQVVRSHQSDRPPRYHLTSHSQSGRSLPQSATLRHYAAGSPSELVRQLQQPVPTPQMVSSHQQVPLPFMPYSQTEPFQQPPYHSSFVHEAPSTFGYPWNYSNQMPMNNNYRHYVSHDGGSYQFPHYQNYNDIFKYHRQDFYKPRYKKPTNNNEPRMNSYEISNFNNNNVNNSNFNNTRTRSYGSSSSLHSLNFNSPVNSEESYTNNNEANGLCLDSINKNASYLNLDTHSPINKEVISESHQKQNSTVTPSKNSAAHLTYSTQNVNKLDISLLHLADIAKCSIQKQSTQNCFKEINTKGNFTLSLQEHVVNDRIRDNSTISIRESKAESSAAVFNHETEVIHKTFTIPTVQSTTNKLATNGTSDKNVLNVDSGEFYRNNFFIHPESQIGNNQPLSCSFVNKESENDLIIVDDDDEFDQLHETNINTNLNDDLKNSLQFKNRSIDFCNNLQNVRKQHYEETNDKKQNDNLDQELHGTYCEISKESTDKNQNVECRDEAISGSKQETEELNINTLSKRSQCVYSKDVKVTSNVVHKSRLVECADKHIDVEKQNDDIEQQPHKKAYEENEDFWEEEICTNQQENKDISTYKTPPTKKRSLIVDLSDVFIKINNIEDNDINVECYDEPLNLSKQKNLTCNNLSTKKRNQSSRDEWELNETANNTENRSPSLEGGKKDINVKYQNDAIEQKSHENKQEGKIAHPYNTRSKSKRSYNRDSIEETRHFDSENKPLSLNKQEKRTKILKSPLRRKSVQNLQVNSEEEVEITKNTENMSRHDDQITDKQRNSVVKDKRYKKAHKIITLLQKDILTNKHDNKENCASTTVSGRNRNCSMGIDSEEIGIANNSKNKNRHVDHGGDGEEFKKQISCKEIHKEEKVFQEKNIYINKPSLSSNINNDSKTKDSGTKIKSNNCKQLANRSKKKNTSLGCKTNVIIFSKMKNKNMGKSNFKDELLKVNKLKKNKKTNSYTKKQLVSYDIKHDNEKTNKQKKKINIEMFVDKKKVRKPLCKKTEKNIKYNNQRDNINDRGAVKTNSKKKYNDIKKKRHKPYKRIRIIFDSEEDETGSIQQNLHKKADELDDPEKKEICQQSLISNKINENYYTNKVTNRINGNKFKNSFTNHEETNNSVDKLFLSNKDTQNGNIENETYKEICKEIGILDEEDDQSGVSNKIHNDTSKDQHDILDVEITQNSKTYKRAKCDIRRNDNANSFIDKKYKKRKQHSRDIAQASRVSLSQIVNNCVIFPKPNSELDFHTIVEQLQKIVELNTTNQNLPETSNLARTAKSSKKQRFSFDTLNAKVKRGVKRNKHTVQRVGARLAKITQSPSSCNSTDIINAGNSTFKKPTTIINDKKIKEKNKTSLEKIVGEEIASNDFTHSSTKILKLNKEIYDIEKELEKMFMGISEDSLVISSLENRPDRLSEYKEASDTVNNNNLNNPNNCSINSSNTSAIVGSNLPQTKTTDTQKPSFDTEQYSGQSSRYNLGNQYAVENCTVFETPMLVSNQSLLASDGLAEDGTARIINNAEKYNNFLKKLTFFVLSSIKLEVANNQIKFDEDFQTESRRYRQYFCDFFEQLLNLVEKSMQSVILPLNEYKKFIKYICCYMNANIEFPTTIRKVDRGLSQGLLQFCSENGHENDSKFYLKIVHVMKSLITSIQYEKTSSVIDCLDFTGIDDFVEVLVYHKRTEWYSLFTEEHIVFKKLDEWVHLMLQNNRSPKGTASWTNQTYSNSMCDLTNEISTGIFKNCKSLNGRSIIKKEEICKLTTDGLGNMQDSIIIIDDDDDTELCQSTNGTDKNSDQQRQEIKTELL